MSKVIRIGTIFPSDLNLNGDQANLTVLKVRLNLRGVSCIVEGIDGSNLDGFDALFLGHGSQAAWASIMKQQPALVSRFLETKSPIKFAVGNSVGKILEYKGSIVKKSTWTSEFVEQDGIVGYLNDDLDGPVFSYEKDLTGITILSRLHGPLLAKNPELADRIISEAGWAESTSSPELEKLDELAALSRKRAFEH